MTETIAQEINGVVATIKTDLANDVQWVEQKTAAAVTFLWGIAKPIITGFEPAALQSLYTELATFLAAASTDVQQGQASYIATTFLATLRDTGSESLTIAETVGEDLLTVFAGLAKTAAAKA